MLDFSTKLSTKSGDKKFKYSLNEAFLTNFTFEDDELFFISEGGHLYTKEYTFLEMLSTAFFTMKPDKEKIALEIFMNFLKNTLDFKGCYEYEDFSSYLIGWNYMTEY